VFGVQGFQCPSCKERKNIEEGDREQITTGGIIEEVDALTGKLVEILKSCDSRLY